MLNNIKKRNESGFTIIEVLIVLAIAGLILLVVFLAVPALQRNSHNNQYKTEAGNISSAAQEVLANKQGGSLASGDMAGILTAANAKTITTLTYQGSATAYTPTTASFTAPQTPLNTAFLESNANCPSGGVAGTAGTAVTPSAGTTARSTVLLYSVEAPGNGNYIAQCVQVQ